MIITSNILQVDDELKYMIQLMTFQLRAHLISLKGQTLATNSDASEYIAFISCYIDAQPTHKEMCTCVGKNDALETTKLKNLIFLKTHFPQVRVQFFQTVIGDFNFLLVPILIEVIDKWNQQIEDKQKLLQVQKYINIEKVKSIQQKQTSSLIKHLTQMAEQAAQLFSNKIPKNEIKQEESLIEKPMQEDVQCNQMDVKNLFSKMSIDDK